MFYIAHVYLHLVIFAKNLHVFLVCMCVVCILFQLYNITSSVQEYILTTTGVCRIELTAEAREKTGELYCLRCHDKMGIPICGACRLVYSSYFSLC